MESWVHQHKNELKAAGACGRASQCRGPPPAGPHNRRRWPPVPQRWEIKQVSVVVTKWEVPADNKSQAKPQRTMNICCKYEWLLTLALASRQHQTWFDSYRWIWVRFRLGSGCCVQLKASLFVTAELYPWRCPVMLLVPSSSSSYQSRASAPEVFGRMTAWAWAWVEPQLYNTNSVSN